ncbi:MAG: hypothetical protein Q9191_001291 [Dirinaria sp. TL-2023a]
MASLLKRTPLASQLSHHDRGQGCVAYDRQVLPTYGYKPNTAAGIVFVVVFFITFLTHCVQTVVKRKWWYSLFAVGALGMISMDTSSPCFFSAAIYYVLGQLIRLWGPRYSPLSPRLYLIIFASFDLLSIIIQAVGGGTASKASAAEPPQSTLTGTHEMMAGIIIQLVSMSVFAILFLWVIWSARAVPKDSKTQLLLVTTSVSAACIIIRNFYRAIELSQGWKGYLITHEVYFCVLDGALMVIAAVVFNLVHPAWRLPAAGGPESSVEQETEEKTTR